MDVLPKRHGHDSIAYRTAQMQHIGSIGERKMKIGNERQKEIEKGG